MHITIIGAGYVGLVTASGLSELGCNVTCVDVDEEKIARLQDGDVPIFEPGLDDLVKRQQQAGRLTFVSEMSDTVARSAAVFLAVGTPPLGDGRADISFVTAAAREVAKSISRFSVIVIKSTVPVGTASVVTRLIRETNPGADFSVASNPEFLREGSAIADFMRPDRVVLGFDDPRAGKVLNDIYEPLAKCNVPIVCTDITTSELIKYAANSFLATKVAFINEMADLCSTIEANVDHLSLALGLDARIGKSFLRPGPGYGGSCFPKDTMALAAQAQEADTPVRIVEATVASNAHHIRRLVRKIEFNCLEAWNRLGLSELKLAGKTIAVLGLAFKSNTDDVRYAASTVLVPQLEKMGAHVKAYDPAAMETASAAISDLVCCDTITDAVNNADAVLILTEWPEFVTADWNSLKKHMKFPVIIDLRNLYELEAMSEVGIYYYSLGRPAVNITEESETEGDSHNNIQSSMRPTMAQLTSHALVQITKAQ